jgi:hypothetical protein
LSGSKRYGTIQSRFTINPIFMLNTQPSPLSSAEWDEVAGVREVREDWGLQSADHGAALASVAYGARFDFVSGSPGYVGDMFVIVGDGLSAPPMVLIRDRTTGSLLPVTDY